jgi:hypothetical protein
MLEAARASRRARLLLRGEDEDEDEEEFHGEALCMSDQLARRGPPPRSDVRLACEQLWATGVVRRRSSRAPGKERMNRSRLSARVRVAYIGRARELALGRRKEVSWVA